LTYQKKILELIAQGENEKVEFKTSFNDEVVETLVAFSNSQGGSIYLGVADNGEIKGLYLGNETIQNWINEIKNKTIPAIISDIELQIINKQTIAIIRVIEYPIKPISFKGKYFKRVANSNHLMSIDEIANEHLKTLNASWDYYTDPNHDVNHISLTKVELLLKKIAQQTQSREALSPIEFLTKMEIVRNGKLTFGGYLLFANDYCLISDLQVGRFKSETTIIIQFRCIPIYLPK